MPRRSAADALLTRDAIVRRAVDVASVDGLEGVTIGGLAADLEMSKAGVLGHFGTKETLQLAALERAISMFADAVWAPVAHVEPGLSRLHAIVESWTAYLAGDAFPGGCFLTAVSFEFDDRSGPVRERLERALARWDSTLGREARTAVDAGELLATTDPEQLAFELGALAVGSNQARRMLRDPGVEARTRAAMHAVLDRATPVPARAAGG